MTTLPDLLYVALFAVASPMAWLTLLEWQANGGVIEKEKATATELVS